MDKSSYKWQSVSFIGHQRSASWVAILILSVLIAAAAVFLLSSWAGNGPDYMAPVVIVVFGLILVATSLRKAETIDYAVSPAGVTINGHETALEELSSYSIKQYGTIYEVDFQHNKRLRLPVSVYCSEEDAGKVVSILGDSLPLVDAEHGWFDQLLRRFRL